MTQQQNDQPQTEQQGSPPVPAPESMVVVGVMLVMTADGKLHVQRAPMSPRLPSLNDIYTLCSLAQRDVNVKMIGDVMLNAQAQAMGLMQQLMAGGQPKPAKTPAPPAE